MGYSADMVSTNRDIVLLAEKLPQVIEKLYAAENGGLSFSNHISWCDPLDNYDQSNPAEFVARVFADYGFDGAHATDNGDVDLGYWGGDKLGSSFDEMMEAAAAGVGERTETVWRGEDGSMWGILFDGEGSLSEGNVTVAVNW